MSKCPNCGKEIKPLYMKQNCPHCKVNLPYFDMEARLEADAVKAEREFLAWSNFCKNIKNSLVGNAEAIARLILIAVFLLALMIPSFRLKTEALGLEVGKQVGLINFVGGLVSGTAFKEMSFGQFFSEYALKNGAYLVMTLYFAASILAALLGFVFSLFSFTKHSLAREMVFWATYFQAAVVCGGLAISKGVATVGLGFVLQLLLVAVIAGLTVAMKLNNTKLEDNKNNIGKVVSKNTEAE